MTDGVARDVEAKTKAHKSSMALPLNDKIFYGINNAVLAILLLLVAIPIVNVFANSFSSGDAVAAGKVFFWPVKPTLSGYVAVFKDKLILSGYKNTILYTLVGTAINVVMTVLAAYPLSRREMPGRNLIMMLFSFTMIFSGGMVPNYILMKDLRLLDTFWVMVVPLAISVYNMIICRTFFQTTLPEELHEAAQLDGCNEFRYLARVAIPLSKPVLAVITLYYAVGHWNAFFNAFLYLTTEARYPLQIVLRGILIANTIDPMAIADIETMSIQINLVEVLKYALIVVACVPIWCVYPFVQKFFVQGAMIGSIKG